MNRFRILLAMLLFTTTVVFTSCGPSIKITSSWVNREKIPPEPIKSVFIIAMVYNMELRTHLENDMAAAAEQRGMKAYKSMDIIGPVDLHLVAPVKDVFLKKLTDLNCESIFTIAVVDVKSETRYVPGSNEYPYNYSGYGGYGGYAGYGGYGGFGGYYSYTVNIISTPGYYTTDNTYFIEAKLFDLKTGDPLLSIQSKASNPDGIEKSSKQYTQAVMDEMKEMNIRKKK